MIPIFAGQPAKLSEADARTIERLSNRINKRLQSFEPSSGMFTIPIINRTGDRLIKYSAVAFDFGDDFDKFKFPKDYNPIGDEMVMLEFKRREVKSLYPIFDGIDGNYRDHCGQCGVLLDNVEPDKIARMQIGGYSWAWIYLRSEYTIIPSSQFTPLPLRPIKKNINIEDNEKFEGRRVPFLFTGTVGSALAGNAGSAHIIHPTKVEIKTQRVIPYGIQLARVYLGTSRYRSWFENWEGFNE